MQSSKSLQRLASQLLQKYGPSSAIIPPCSIQSASFLSSKTTLQVSTVTPPTRPFSTSAPIMSSSTTTTPIHILGLGNLGKLFAHSLTTSSAPSPVIILTHRPGLPYAFQQSGSAISILRNGIVTSTPTGLVSISPISPASTSPIKNLIVTTKAAHTASALKPLLSRLGPESTIIFTQNGMGVLDEVNQLCFPEVEKRPNYLAAIVVHGVFSTGPFSATHAAVADLKIGYTLTSSSPGESQSAKELLNKIVAAEALVAKGVEPRELIAVQLEKLIVNACINPLTVIFRTLNGALLDPLVTPLRRVLCQEGSAVFLKYLDSTVGLDEELRERFEKRRLEDMVREVTERVRENKSSMYQDFEAGRETEIRYINGWFAKRGQEYGIDVDTHERLVELVERKEEVKMDDIGVVFPKTRAMT